MEEQETEVESKKFEHKRSKIILWLSLAGTVTLFIATGTVLIATGELKQSVTNSKEADGVMLNQIKINTSRLYSIESNQEKHAVRDSVRDVKLDEVVKDIRVLKGKVNNLEWIHRIKPSEYDLSPSGNTKPSETSTLSLQK